jgi:hypothetical protein
MIPYIALPSLHIAVFWRLVNVSSWIPDDRVLVYHNPASNYELQSALDPQLNVVGLFLPTYFVSIK